MNPTTPSHLIYTDKKGRQFYRAAIFPEALPAFHKGLMWLHIFYLFVLPSVAIVLIEMHFEGSPVFRLTGWLILTMYISFTINNYKMPVSKSKATWNVFIIPFELFVGALLFTWGWAYEVIEWAFIELVGFFLGLVLGTIFRDAPISIGHRILSFFIVLFLGIAVLAEFWAFIDFTLEKSSSIRLYFLVVPFITAIYNYLQLFTTGEFGGEHDVNLGTAELSEKITPLIAIFAIIWLLLPSVGKALS